ncbi:unnamed protein product [Tilletia controversa]|nr:unnamed protein product [Tilletia controversa]
MASAESQQAETQAGSIGDALQRPPRSLHRVSSKHLGSGSGAGLWLSTGHSPSDQAVSHKAEHSSDNEGGSDTDNPARVRFHDSAKPQAVSPTAATPTSGGSKLYHFPATLARGLRFLTADNSEGTGAEKADPVAKLQEHNLLRMSSKEELEQSVDLDLSFDFYSTAERPLPPVDGQRPVLAPLDLQSAFTPLPSSKHAEESNDKSEKPVASTPSTPGRSSPGRGMSATNWKARAAKQPPAPLDLSATNPAKLSSDSTSMDIIRHSSSTDVARTGSIRTMNSLDSGRLPGTGESEPRTSTSESMSFVSHQSNQSRSSRGSRAPPSLPPSVPLPPIPDSSSSARGSLASNRGNSTLKPIENIINYSGDSQEFSGDEYREELRDSESEKLDENGKRTSGGSNYSGESGESFKTAGVGSMAHSSTDNLSGSASQHSTLPPLPPVPSVIWRQRQQRIERQVAAAATTRASAVPAAFAIDSVVMDKSALPLAAPAPPSESPRLSFGFQSPTPETLKRWSSIPSQLAALVVGASGPIQPVVPPMPIRSNSSVSPQKDALSPQSNARLSIVTTPTTDASSPFSPLFSDPGTAVSVGTTMSRTSTQQSTGVHKSGAALPSTLERSGSIVEEDSMDRTMTQLVVSALTPVAAGPQKRGSVNTAQWIKDQSSQPVSLERESQARDSTASSVHLGANHTRHNSNQTGGVITSDSEIEGDMERAKKRRLPMHISTSSESSHAGASSSALHLPKADLPSGPWPQSPLLLTSDPNRASREYALSQTSRPSMTLRAHRSTQLTSMFGLGLGLDLGLSGDLQAPKDARLSLGASTHSGSVRDSILRKAASDSGLAKPNSPHTELDMTIFADQGPEPTVVNLHSAMHAGDKSEGNLPNRRSRLLDMLHSDAKSGRADASTAVAVDNFRGSRPDEKKPRALSVANTPSTLPMLSPRPISSPYMGRLGIDISAASSVEAFACNVTPPMPSISFAEREPAMVKRAGERKSDGQFIGSSWMNKAQNVPLRLSYRIATASWMPNHVFKHDLAEPSSRPVKEKQSPLPTPIAIFEPTSEGGSNQRASMASAISNTESRMRRRRSTMTTTWSPVSDPSATLRSEPRVMASIKGKPRRTKAVFGNAAYNSPARTPATTNMLPNGTLLSKSLFFAGFCGMPWLWLIGGWWVEFEGLLVTDVMVKTAASADVTADTDSDTDSTSDSDSSGERTIQQQVQYYDVLVRKDWNGLEQYVRYNRVASVVGAVFILLAFILAIWGAAVFW